MKKVNRLDVYLGNGYAIDEALEIISTWGNRQGYDPDPKKHLVNNMTGWLGEEIFHVNFPNWEYINEEEHTYLSESINPASRKGEPDFINPITGQKCEVKIYLNQEKIDKQINKWKNNPGELHNADVIVILNRNKINPEDKDNKIEINMLYTDSWEYKTIPIKVKYPTWFKGFMKK